MLGCIPRIALDTKLVYVERATREYIDIPVSPASPLKAMRVFLFSCLVLSSLALRMVAPRIAAFEAATMQKSFPVIPSSTSMTAVVEVVRREYENPNRVARQTVRRGRVSRSSLNMTKWH